MQNEIPPFLLGGAEPLVLCGPDLVKARIEGSFAEVRFLVENSVPRRRNWRLPKMEIHTVFT